MEGYPFSVLSLLFVFALWGGCHSVVLQDLCRSLKFTTPFNGYALQGHLIKNISLHVGTNYPGICKDRCTMESYCVSFNIGPPIKDKVVCELSDSDHMQHPIDLVRRQGFMYRGTENPCASNPCLNNGTCLNGFTDKKYLCLCQAGYTGDQCAKVFNAVFTNLGASGRNGPTSLGSYYTGQDHDGQVTLSRGIQQWTVSYTGDYRIEAVGAAGGYDTHTNSTQYRGRGARMVGTFRLSKGEVIQILVGQEGGINSVDWSSGGGGGTYVVSGSNTSLIIAGGGGGIQAAGSRHPGCDANTSISGNAGHKSWEGGSGGYGAQILDYDSGGGGGGLYSNGTSSVNYAGVRSGGEGGNGFLQGGVGGRSLYYNVTGGFGGGGGADGLGYGGGGGGGYSGGGAGDDKVDSCGGGGGSYNDGRDQENECCYQEAGHGHVTVTFLE